MNANNRDVDALVRLPLATLKQVFTTKDQLYDYIQGKGGHLPNKQACDLPFLREIMDGTKHVRATFLNLTLGS